MGVHKMSVTAFLLRVVVLVLMMLGIRPSDEQLCYPGSNLSCIRTAFPSGAKFGLFVVFWLGIMVTILGNSVVILSIAHFKQLHSPTNMLVMSLALADLLLGLTVMPFSASLAVEGCWFYSDSFCLLHTSFYIFLTSVSILNVVFISVDRYEAVCNPLRYVKNVTMSVARFIALACWVVAAFYSYGLIYSRANVAGLEDLVESMYCFGSCNLIFNTLPGTFDSVLFFFFPCAVMTALYTRIFLVAIKHARKIKDSNKYANAKGDVSRKSEHKAAKTLGIVVGVFIICWMPVCLCSIIGQYKALSLPASLFKSFTWLAYFNSTMNPIIYGLFYPWFRKCSKIIITLKILNRNSSDMNVF